MNIGLQYDKMSWTHLSTPLCCKKELFILIQWLNKPCTIHAVAV